MNITTVVRLLSRYLLSSCAPRGVPASAAAVGWAPVWKVSGEHCWCLKKKRVNQESELVNGDKEK